MKLGLESCEREMKKQKEDRRELKRELERVIGCVVETVIHGKGQQIRKEGDRKREIVVE